METKSVITKVKEKKAIGETDDYNSDGLTGFRRARGKRYPEK